MTISKQDIAEGAAWARRTLRKPEREGALKTPAERCAEWLREQADQRQAQRPSTERVSAEVFQTRHQLHRPGGEFSIGDQRFAADGSRWQRTA